MNSKKREIKWEVFAFRIFKSLRNCSLLLICSAFLLAVSVNTASAETTATQQQTVKISGTVTDASGEALIGVSVIERGTSTGTVTDMDGAFTLNVAPNATIEARYVGYVTQTLRVIAGTTEYRITMKEDAKSLDEVVVVGYGVQKKKLVTGANIQVGGDNIQKLSTTNTFTALQSQSPGVSIISNNGQPGAGYIVNIRGLGTNGESRPLYVIDGVPAGNDALNNMSPADIETVDILKDAASCAIYGSRGANGVILITTKQGKSGKPKITYDAFYGQQYMYKKPDMLNAKEYIQMQNEMRFNENQTPYDWANLLPNGMYDDIMSGAWNGTDWVNAFYDKGAVTQRHSVNITGGSEYSKFSLGYSYTQQDGIMGEAVNSNYNRHTFRINSDHVLLKAKDFDVIKIGETLNYNYNTNNGISTGNIYWNAFHSVLGANPLLPVYNADGTYYNYDSKVGDGWNFDGGTGNPIGNVATSAQGLNFSRSNDLRASAYVEIQPIKGLTFKSLYGYHMSASSYRSQDQMAHWSTTSQTTSERVDQNTGLGYDWSLTNTLNYNKSFGNNNLTVLVGQELGKSGYGDYLEAGANISLFNLGWNYAWLANTNPSTLAQRSAYGNPGSYKDATQSSRASFFGRVNYDYKETYLLTAILRTDGSSNFIRGKRWGTFPSVSAGWILTNEAFMEGAKSTLDYLKLTANWGKNGNDAIDPFQYLSQYKYDNGAWYFFGDNKQIGSQATGIVAGVLKNPDVTWETTRMTDVGFDARFLNSRLGLSFNYYIKDTKGWLLPAPISATWGYDAPNMNGGAVQNKGTELMLTWNDHVRDFTYGVNLNGSYNKNKVTEISNDAGIINGPSNILSQGTTYIYRLQVGEPMGFFYVYKTDGILQNQAEADAYNAATGSHSQPGDVRFVDTNHDGKIDDTDRVNIGNSQPTTQMGFTLNLGYKGFDFSVNANGAFGFLIAKSYRSFADSPLTNFTTDVFERWTGEGTSNKWPRLTLGNNSNYQLVSDLFFEKGDYVRMQNVTLGYDFKKLYPQMPLGQARLYVSAQNLFTITGYSGMDPDIGYAGQDSNNNDIHWAKSVDLGFYPVARTYLVGINLTF